MKKKPNIIFILSDDQGAWSMHCAGTPELYTPNLRLKVKKIRMEAVIERKSNRLPIWKDRQRIQTF